MVAWLRKQKGTGAPALFAALLPVLLAVPLHAPAAAALPGPDMPSAEQTPVRRVQTILRRILIANHASCPDPRHDHGVMLGEATLFPGGAPVVAVAPDGAAEAAGLRPGDLVRGVNGTPWSPDPAEAAAFARALGATGETRELALVIERDHTRLALVLQGQPACRGEARLAATGRVGAAAIDHTIIIEGGLERLLRDDAELAFAVAHEAAHVMLGHTDPANRSAIGDRPRRQAMERDADALAVRLMARAGYDPKAAATAWPKIADASRPPLHRLMDLHGPYMATAERTAFLKHEAARLDRPGPIPPNHAR